MLPDQSGERLNGNEACKEVPSLNQEVLVELDHWGAMPEGRGPWEPAFLLMVSQVGQESSCTELVHC